MPRSCCWKTYKGQTIRELLIPPVMQRLEKPSPTNEHLRVLSTPDPPYPSADFTEAYSVCRTRNILARQMNFSKPPWFDNRLSCKVLFCGARHQPEPLCVQMENASNSPLRFTYLEVHGCLIEIGGRHILIDPLLVGNLDFNVPRLFEGVRKNLHFQLEDLPEIHGLLITQELDDHCHVRTLEPLSRIFPDVRVVATSKAKPILDKLFPNATYLRPGESTTWKFSNLKLRIRAAIGQLAFWQPSQSGYFLESDEPKISIFLEPHCAFDRDSLKDERADVVVSTVIRYKVCGLQLTYGQEDAVELTRLLQAKYFVAIDPGDVNYRGPVPKLIYSVGTTARFKDLLAEAMPDAVVIEPKAGYPLEIPAN